IHGSRADELPSEGRLELDALSSSTPSVPSITRWLSTSASWEQSSSAAATSTRSSTSIDADERCSSTCSRPDHPDLAPPLNHLAVLVTERGRSEEAAALHRRAIAILEQSLQPDHPDAGRLPREPGCARH